MADFNKAIRFTRKQEGGYANVPGDSGAETYCGISRRYNPHWEGWPEVDRRKPLKWNEVVDNALLDEMVNSYYHLAYWAPLLLDQVHDEAIAAFLFDWHVNAGVPPIQAMQRLVGVDDDGVIGHDTISAINEACGTAESACQLFQRLKMTRETFYRTLAADNPKDKRFLDGWLKRVNDFSIS